MLMVVGPDDSTLFECEKFSDNDSVNMSHQLTLYASMDLLDDALWKTGDFFLPSIDKPLDGKYSVSAYVGLAPIKLLLMKEHESDKETRLFLSEAYGLCVRYLMNPFSSLKTPVRAVLAENLRRLYQRFSPC
ncbi:Sedlin [Trypanosoma brucei equiperdum]|nr:Sedlin [Trypanosoma brucei equiperdum]